MMVRRSLILWACFFGILAAADKGYLNSYSDSQTSVSPDKDALELNENNDPSTFKEKEEGEGLLDDGSSVNEDQGLTQRDPRIGGLIRLIVRGSRGARRSRSLRIRSRRRRSRRRRARRRRSRRRRARRRRSRRRRARRRRSRRRRARRRRSRRRYRRGYIMRRRFRYYKG
ncbi:arginine/serine-rich coiled-coil protein 2-like [Rhopilema esculentum]|uniref:arginine/serine-rich coiled-coil protein 2-like n=1 Tax=Rhopilema esculentum TaxID=499914 RepID=UPI0031E45F40